MDLQGGLVDIEGTIAVALLGSPQSTDITVNLTVAPSTTIEPQMYEMSASSITIPAGQTSGSFNLTAFAAEMPVDEELDLVLVIDAGDKNAPVGDTLKYSLKRINFCPWTLDDMVGVYTGDEITAWGVNVYGATFEVFKVNETTIAISGLFQAVYGPTYWGEVVTAGDRPEFTYMPNGLLGTQNQWICETDNAWNYYMGPGGGDIKWNGCDESFTIPYYFHWDSDYGDNIPVVITMTKNGKKGKVSIETPELERTFHNLVPTKR